jgi:hypothetical protein
MLSKFFRTKSLLVAAVGSIFIVIMIIAGATVANRLSQIRENRIERMNLLAKIQIGMAKEEILEFVQDPNEICSNDSAIDVHRSNTKDPSILPLLKEKTKEHWILYLKKDRKYLNKSTCVASYEDADIGFGEDGKVLWFQLMTGETWLNYDRSKIEK